MVLMGRGGGQQRGQRVNTKVVKRKGQENRVGKLLAQILVHQSIHSFAAHLNTHQTKPPALKASTEYHQVEL